MSVVAHSRRFDGVLITSGLPRFTDIFRTGWHVSTPNSSHGTHSELEATVAEESATDVA
jgi:hypothetical protein